MLVAVLLAYIQAATRPRSVLERYYDKVAAQGVFLRWDWGVYGPDEQGWFAKGPIFRLSENSRMRNSKGGGGDSVQVYDGNRTVMVHDGKYRYAEGRAQEPMQWEPAIYPLRFGSSTADVKVKDLPASELSPGQKGVLISVKTNDITQYKMVFDEKTLALQRYEYSQIIQGHRLTPEAAVIKEFRFAPSFSTDTFSTAPPAGASPDFDLLPPRPKDVHQAFEGPSGIGKRWQWQSSLMRDFQRKMDAGPVHAVWTCDKWGPYSNEVSEVWINPDGMLRYNRSGLFILQRGRVSAAYDRFLKAYTMGGEGYILGVQPILVRPSSGPEVLKDEEIPSKDPATRVAQIEVGLRDPNSFSTRYVLTFDRSSLALKSMESSGQMADRNYAPGETMTYRVFDFNAPVVKNWFRIGVPPGYSLMQMHKSRLINNRLNEG